jgi:hypothetical protein
MISTSKSKKTSFCRIALCFAVVCALLSFASASENGASVYPVGVETVLTGLQPHPGETMFYEYTAVVAANETDNSNGQKLPIEFKLRVFATAIKVDHTWGFKLFGTDVHSFIAVPIVFQELHIPPGNFSKYSIANVCLVPAGFGGHKGMLHWYVEPTQMFMPGTAYSKNDHVNLGQHNLAFGPDVAVTLLPNKAKTEISSHTTYIWNGYDKDTNYHSGNQFSEEFNFAEKVTKKVALGINGFYSQQTTDDHQYGQLVHGDGNRGRDLAIGPQLRFDFPHGGFAFKYYRDTLVQNQARGNTFWFQIAVPFNGLNSHREKL